MLPWAGRFGCNSYLGSLGVSMGWLVCVFQCTVCVRVFCGDSVDWWLWVFHLSFMYIFLDQRFTNHVYVAF